LSAARASIVGLGKQACGAIAWYVNIDGKDGREVPNLKSGFAKRDLVREAMMNCELHRSE
jgi:hypothetical protein